MSENEEHNHETQDFTTLQAELARKDAYIRELEAQLARAATRLMDLDSYRAAEIRYLSAQKH